ncbi:Panacea domain-containing protein [Desulfobacterales bacterium HSG17]|nr:Panacea domain-containing protein [Desulfobacterales bacterium HSG17]
MCLTGLMQKILARYDGQLHNAALTKMVYLIDIESVKKTGNQITSISWVRDNYGPFVWDVLNSASENQALFAIGNEGNGKRLICSQIDIEIERCEVDELLAELVEKIPNPKTNFLSFVDYVYDTPPMFISTSNGPLDIQEAMESAKEVDELVEELLSDPEWDEAFAYLAAH